MPIKQGKSNKITLGLVTGVGLKLAEIQFHAPTGAPSKKGNGTNRTGG